MIQKIIKMFQYFIITLIILSLVITGLIFAGFISIIDDEDSKRGTTQFHSINEKDEYIIAEEIDHITYNLSSYRYILKDWLIGKSEVELSLDAHFKYYIKFSELTYDNDERTLILNIPKLYLSTPVAFNSATMKKKEDGSILGPPTEKLYEKLLSELSLNLINHGSRQKNNVRNKAAQSIAENLNDFLSNNNSSGHYDFIKVVFKDDKRDVIRLYEFDNSFCGTIPCKFELEFIDGKTLVIE